MHLILPLLLFVFLILEPVVHARLIFPGDVGRKRIIVKDRNKYPITQTVSYRFKKDRTLSHWRRICAWLLIKARKDAHPIVKRQTEENISIQRVYQLPKQHFYKSTHYQSRCAQGGPCPGITAWAKINQNR